MGATNDAKQNEKMLRAKQQRVSELYPTLFSPDASRIFLGQSMLQTSSKEKDPRRQDELVNKAMEQFMVNPSGITMD